MHISRLTVAILLVGFTANIDALIDIGDLPTQLQQCFEMKTEFSNVTEVPSEDICVTCITDYLWKYGNHVHCFKKAEHNLEWVAQLLVELHPTTASRQKRTPPKERRRRKEYRMLTDQERERYHLAINRMKSDTVRKIE